MKKKQRQILGRTSLTELQSSAAEQMDRDEYRRFSLVILVASGETVRRASEIIPFNYDHARELVERFIQDGPEGLKDRRKTSGSRPPRNDLLSNAQKEELRSTLSRPCPAGGLWTGPKVAKEIARISGRDHVWPQRGWEYLKCFGFRLRRPRRRHVKANDEEQEAFLSRNSPAP